MEPSIPLGEMENRPFSIWKLLVAGQGSSLMFLLSLENLVSAQRVHIGSLSSVGVWVAAGLTNDHPLNRPELEACIFLLNLKGQRDGTRTGCKNVEVRKTHTWNAGQGRQKKM